MSALTRPDPAPSRLKYRLERLMLTPVFRFALRVGLPFTLAFGAGTAWLSQDHNRDALLGLMADIRAEVETRPEFMVNLMEIDGASATVAEDIREILPLDFPVSSFDLDLDVMRDAVMGLDAVKAAQIRVRSGGILQVDITERQPVVVWRHRDGLELVDAEGVSVRPIERRADHADLPLIAGEGADAYVPEAMTLLAALGPLKPRTRALLRVGERRWDVVLDRDQVIQLPDRNPVQALERAIVMDQAFDLLDRDVVAVDLRLPQRPTVRLTQDAVTELRRIRAIEVGETQE